jgi:glycosyltransferase involved in cell wall biosynthesis
LTVTFVTTPGDGSCGIGTYTSDLLNHLDVDTETVHIPQDDRSVSRFVSLALQVFRAGGDVVHFQHEYGLFRREGSKYPGLMGLVFFPLVFLLSSLRGRPVVVTMHSVLTSQAGEASFSVRLYLLCMHKLLATGASHLIFLSPNCATAFRTDINPDSSTYSVLPHGVKRDIPDVQRDLTRRRLGYDSDDKVVAIPGFVRPPKGHDIFVEIARRLPEFEFLVAGGARPEGDDFEFAERIRTDAPDNVTVTGPLDEDKYWATLATPDLAVLPYRVVTQSGTFNACASRELPVLASDVDYFTRIQSEWGALETVDITDVDAVVDRVRALVEDESRRRELADAIRQYKRANSFERVGTIHCRIYTRIVDDSFETPANAEMLSQPNADSTTPQVGACSAQQSVSTD